MYCFINLSLYERLQHLFDSKELVDINWQGELLCIRDQVYLFIHIY